MRPELGTFSALYDQETLPNQHQFKNRRLVYVDRNSKSAVFAYCSDKRYWTFQFQRENLDNVDPCTGWLARSSAINSFDITASASSPWFVRDQNQREAFLEPFTLMCHDCGRQYNDCNGRHAAHLGVLHTFVVPKAHIVLLYFVVNALRSRGVLRWCL